MSVNKNEIKKVVLAYSGGLDTSIIIPWLKENYNNPEIIAVSGNVGQADELEGLEEKALKTGASKLIVADLVDEMCDDVIVPSLKSICWVLPLLVPSSARSWRRSPWPKVPTPWCTAAPARATTRSGSSWPSSGLLLA